MARLPNGVPVLALLGLLGLTLVSVHAQPCIIYDYVVAGGGAVGAAVAGKLADSGASVLVLEQGGDNCTACYTTLLSQTGLASPPYMSKILSKEQEFLDGRGNILYGFKGLGGGTQIYGQTNNRATPEQLAKNPPGFRYPDILPYYQQLEDHFCNYLPQSYTGISPAECAAYHGKNGPMHVQISAIGVASQLDLDLVAAAKNGTFGPTVPFTADYNGPSTRVGFAWAQSFRNIVGNKSDPNAPRTRGNTYDNYLKVARQQKLRIITFATVLKLLITPTKQVYGVTYNINGRDGPYIAIASKEVFIAMGAYNTPAFLERSGIGDPAILAKFGIPLVASNPAVGNGLKAHQTILFGYQTTMPVLVNETLNGDTTMIGFLKAPNSPELQGALQIGFIEGEETNSFDNAFTGPDVIVVAAGTQAAFTGAPANSITAGFVCNTNPKINGSVHIQSSSSDVEPAVDLGWTNAAFTASSPDYQDLLYGLSVVRNVFGGNNTFAKKWIVQEVYPGTRYSSAYNLVAPAVPAYYVGPLSEQDHVQHDLNTVYHTGCTVALGNATDLNGAVLGVRGLTVVGNALMPIMPDGNPTTFSIALAMLITDRMLAHNGGTSKIMMPDNVLQGFCQIPHN